MGFTQILFVLLGLQVTGSSFEGVNTTLKKLNLSGLSLPEREVTIFARHFPALTSLINLSFNGIKSYNQGGGYHDLGEGIDAQDLLVVMNAVITGSQQREGPHLEKLTIANKLTNGSLDFSLLDCHHSDLLTIKHLDLSGLDLTGREGFPLSWLAGCQSLNLSDCKLGNDPERGSLAGTGALRRVDLSRTTVSEESLRLLLARNPYITSINLTGCRGIPVTQRRNYFKEEKED